MISRRDLAALIGGAALALPVRALAQAGAVPVVGFAHPAIAETYADMVTAFRGGLAEAGYVEGKNVAIELRWGNNRPGQLPALADDLVRHGAAAIVIANPTAAAVKSIKTVPVVFVMGSDPVTDGVVPSLARPGGNATGVTFFTVLLTGKRLGLLRQMLPKAATIAILAGSGVDASDVEAAVTAGGQKPLSLKVGRPEELDKVFAAAAEQRADGVLILSSPFMTSHRSRIVALAARRGLPAIYPLREYVTAGGLMSYGANIADTYRQAGLYAGKVLKGVKPSDLPVLQPTKFELAINLNTAKALGLAVPPTLLALADTVIEE